MRLASRVPGVVCGAAVVAVMTVAANTPLTIYTPDQALLRLAWSARPERIERCRQQTAAELARLPVHMRQPVVCEGATARYRLTVVIDGTPVTERVLRAGGLRHDRRLYVVEEIPLRPGVADIEVRFDRDDDGASARPGAPSASPLAGAVPPRLSLREQVRVAPREVVLITYGPERRALISRQGSMSAGR